MKKNQRVDSIRDIIFLAIIVLGLLFPPLLKADVVVLQNGEVIPCNVLQKDINGVLIKTEYGTYRYPTASIKEVKQEANTVHHLTRDGQPIPDWSQIVVMLATNGWAEEIHQVPATVINYGKFDHVPYVAFRCASGGYELDIFGDLDDPAAVQIGAVSYLKNSPAARTNCINFICSMLPNAKVREAVRALDLTQKQLSMIGNMTLETVMPGEWGSYGGWWVSVYDTNALAKAAASDADMLALTQPAAAPPQPQPAAAQPGQPPAAQPGQPATGAAPEADTSEPATTTTTTYGYSYGWTSAELANARPAASPAYNPAATAAQATPRNAAAPASPAGASHNVYPRNYSHTGGNYRQTQPRRR